MADEREQDECGAPDQRPSDPGLHDEPNADSASGHSSPNDDDKTTSRPSGARATRPRGEPKNVSDEDPKP
jgi:hypothetical protein